jgi:Fic family protein
LRNISDVAELAGSREIDELVRNMTALKPREISALKLFTPTLAIEGNTLNLGQVTDIINGKTVNASLREVIEVKNTFNTYTNLDSFSIKQCKGLF